MIIWDENKRRLNLKLHGIDFADVESVFDHPMDTEEDKNHNELRLRSLGLLQDHVVRLIWTPVGDDVRIISCRYGDKYETRKYIKTLLYSGTD